MEEDFYFKDKFKCKCNECLKINPVISYREIDCELNKTIEFENETSETFSKSLKNENFSQNNVKF
jgi:hypothetical protein